MKVKELIQALENCDPNSHVILQKDSEGNGYSPLEGADGDCVYVAESTYSGEVEWTADMAGMDEAEWNKMLKRKRCVVLFPKN